MVLGTTEGVLALDLAGPKEAWFLPSLSLVGADEHSAYAARGKTLVRLSAEGKTAWSTSLPFEPSQALVLDDRVVAGAGRAFAAVDTQGGLLWTYTHPEVPPSPKTRSTLAVRPGPRPPWLLVRPFERRVSPMVSCDGRLVIASTQGVRALTFDGTAAWTRTLDGPANGAIVAGPHSVLVGSTHGRLTELRCADGREVRRWSFPHGVAALTWHAGLFYGLAGDDLLFAFDADGHAKWAITASGRSGCRPRQHRCLFVAAGHLWRAPHGPIRASSFEGLSLEGQAELRVIPPGNEPAAPMHALDDRSESFRRYERPPMLEHDGRIIITGNDSLSFHRIDRARTEIP